MITWPDIDWHAVGTWAFWIAIAAGLGIMAYEAWSAHRERPEVIVMERPEFADTQPEPQRAIVAAAERVLARVPPYLEEPDFTEPMRPWDRPTPATVYRSGGSREIEPKRVEP